MNLFKKPRAWFEKLDPERQRTISRVALLTLLVTVSLLAYYGSERKKTAPKAEEGTFEELQPRLGYLEKSLYYETESKVKALEGRLDTLSLELKAFGERLAEEQGNEKEGAEQEIETPRKEIESLGKKEEEESKALPAGSEWGVPPPPGGAYQKSSGARGTGQEKREPPRVIGGVGRVRKAPDAEKAPSEPAAKAPEEKKDAERTVYLPPSFVEADLISGFAAPTMEAAKSEPVRVLLRIRDLAVLPNELKGDIEGCFAIAEGYGNLAEERAHLRLLTLSCVARDGTSVIDEAVKGFVVDEDGRIGLRGRVVTKMGSLLARTMIAAFLEGFGEAYSQSAFDLNTTAAGQIQTLKPDKAFRSGVGEGISKGAEGLSKFYLEMARQTFPVIEVGAGKRITMVVDNGVDLKIRRRCLGGRDGCRDEKRSSISALADL